MRRRAPQMSADAAGQDSFLDVVANMVGILIILVMVVGVRAGRSTIEPPEAAIPASPAEQAPAESALADLQQEAFSLKSEVLEIDRQAKQVQQAIAIRRAQQEHLATLIAAIKEELEAARNKLDTESQEQYDLRRKLAEAQAQLEQLEREQSALETVQPQTIEVQNLPTPISKTVHGRELHLQLRNGRVAFIPLDALLDKFKSDAPKKVWKFQNQQIVSDTVGPLEGFRLRYELEQKGAMVRLVQWELLPVSDDLGEPVETALAEGGRFRSLLDSLDRSSTTLTIWTYPESFPDFRTLKAELHARGFATAGRPLPATQPIGGSPEGSRSAAQ